MSRKSLFLAIAIVLALAGMVGSGLGMVVRHVPAFYARAAVPAGEGRKSASGNFLAACIKMVTGFSNGEFDAQFQEEEINSYLQEDWVTKHCIDNPMPPGISDPRVALDEDRIRLGFRYGSGLASTIVSLDMRVWLVKSETNLVALKFEKIHAGALPISAQSLLEQIADFAHQKDIEATWYRHQGRPVLLLRFQADRSNPNFQLSQLDLRPGQLRIAGQSLPVAMMVKESINRAFETSLAEGIRFERRLFHASFGTADQKEGMAAFVEKRKPAFRNR